MFTITKTQEELFRQIAVKDFEDRLVAHIKQFFPFHYKAIGGVATINTIRYAIKKARAQGFKSEQGICLYLNNMLLLGSNFDDDPQYSWINRLLDKRNHPNAQLRIAKLSEEIVAMYKHFGGEDFEYIKAAVANLKDSADTTYADLAKGESGNAVRFLLDLYPEKYDMVNAGEIENTITFGIEKAKKYGITTGGNVLIFIMVMFFTGSNFDTDPQYDMLNDTITGRRSETDKARQLFYKFIEVFSNYLSE